MTGMGHGYYWPGSYVFDCCLYDKQGYTNFGTAINDHMPCKHILTNGMTCKHIITNEIPFKHLITNGMPFKNITTKGKTEHQYSCVHILFGTQLMWWKCEYLLDDLYVHNFGWIEKYGLPSA